jgi:hypothetical protein
MSLDLVGRKPLNANHMQRPRALEKKEAEANKIERPLCTVNHSHKKESARKKERRGQ